MPCVYGVRSRQHEAKCKHHTKEKEISAEDLLFSVIFAVAFRDVFKHPRTWHLTHDIFEDVHLSWGAFRRRAMKSVKSGCFLFPAERERSSGGISIAQSSPNKTRYDYARKKWPACASLQTLAEGSSAFRNMVWEGQCPEPTNKNLVLLGTNKPKPKESTKENIVLTAESGKLRVSDLPRDQEPDPPPGNKFSIILMGLRFSGKKENQMLAE